MRKHIISEQSDDAVGIEIEKIGDQVAIREINDLIRPSDLNEILIFKSEIPEIIRVLGELKEE